MRIIYENVILKPPEAVFPWISEPEKAMKWQNNVKGGEIILDKPEIIGTTFNEVIEENGKRLKMSGIITKYIKNKIIGFHIKSKIHEFDISYSVESIKKATKIVIDAEIKWKFPLNIIRLFIGKKMEKGITKQIESEILDLKRMCEAD